METGVGFKWEQGGVGGLAWDSWIAEEVAVQRPRLSLCSWVNLPKGSRVTPSPFFPIPPEEEMVAP